MMAKRGVGCVIFSDKFKLIMRSVKSSMFAAAWLCCFFAGAACSPEPVNDRSSSFNKYDPTDTSLARHQAAPDWFRDAKLGIYFHWGPYTVPAYETEWYPRWMHFDLDEDVWEPGKKPWHLNLKPWHTENFGDLSAFGYHDFVPLFKAEYFDPEQWADLFQEAGARFAGPVAVHADGYAMWDSDVTPWNAADTGPKRDITGELADALRQRGMKLITTFHHGRNLQRYRGLSLAEAKSEWKGKTQFFFNSHYPWFEGQPPTSDDPKLALLYGNMPEQTWLEDVWLGKLKEVVDKYEPDIVWFDSWLRVIPKEKRSQFSAYYLNAAQGWGKDVVITHKHDSLPKTYSLQDFEKGRRDRLTADPWLTDDTISTGSWSYVEGLEVKPARWVLHDFIDIISKNGQLLLNISPRADGVIPENQRAVLRKLGAWLKANGEAVYATRPWRIYGEGPTKMQSDGSFLDHVEYTPRDIRFTARGDVLYAMVLGRPDANITIAALSTGSPYYSGEVTHVEAVSGDFVRHWSRSEAGLVVEFDPEAPPQMAYAIRILGK